MRGDLNVPMKDGTVIEDEIAVADAHPLGARPFGREQYVEKFRTLADGIVAKEEQDRFLALTERIGELTPEEVGEPPTESGVALPGSVVTVYYDDDPDDTETFLLATRQEGITNGELEVYSPNSPLGRALLNAKVNESRTYEVPSGATVKVTLVSAEPYRG